MFNRLTVISFLTFYLLLLQLQHLVSDEPCIAAEELFQTHKSRGGAGGLCSAANQRVHREAAYQRKAEQLLAEENCFKMFIVSFNLKKGHIRYERGFSASVKPSEDLQTTEGDSVNRGTLLYYDKDRREEPTPKPDEQ